MSTSSISQARIIEIGSMTAGIVVPEARGYRFFSSQRSFDALDGRVFRSIRQVTAAARDRLHSNGPLPEAPAPPAPPAKQADVTSDLLLDIPGPFLLPV